MLYITCFRVYMRYINLPRGKISPEGDNTSYTTTSKFVHEYSRDICPWYDVMVLHMRSHRNSKENEGNEFMKRVRQVNTQKKLSLSLKKEKKNQ